MNTNDIPNELQWLEDVYLSKAPSAGWMRSESREGSLPLGICFHDAGSRKEAHG